MCRFDEHRQEPFCPWPCSGTGEPQYDRGDIRNYSAICSNGDRHFERGGDLECKWRGLQWRSVWYHFEWRTLHPPGECAFACDTPSDSDQRGELY